MTARLTRRGAIGLLGAGACAALAAPVARAKAAEASRIAPPRTPMHLSYRVERSLAADARLVTRRDFEVRFAPLAQGFRIEGTQVSNMIDAPPDLAPLAEIWRKSTLPALFPFEIDASGLVVSGSGPDGSATPELGEMIDVSIDMLRRSGSSEAEINDARVFELWLQQAATRIGSDIPRDLFVPPAEIQRANRTIDLPGGASGTIEVSFQGTLSSETGLMRKAERAIVTRTEGTSNRVVEAWSLTPAE